MPVILVVDDERIICDALRTLLAEKGEVDIAVTPSEAIESAVRRPPDLLLVDWTLGADMDGLQLAAVLRKARPDLPTIVMTGYPPDELHWQVAAMSCTWLISKPCRFEELLQAVDEALS